MKIQCQSCQKLFVIDESKYPKLPESVKCPNCKNQITLSQKENVKESPEINEELAAKIKEELIKEIFSLLPLNIPRKKERKNYIADDKPKALICEDEQMFQEVLKESIGRLGYEVEIAPSSKMALEILKRNEYDLVTVDNRFPDDPEGGFKILNAINSLPPEKRRKMFVAFISADLATMDTNSAFVYGANLTVAKKDIKKIESILSQGMEENEKRYRTFFEVWEEVKRSEYIIPPNNKL
ncbi:MAG: response regulator [Acidobacteriota bacterium]|nr:response regulator [Thermoanaerobaculaceae bacterium]